MSTWLTPAQVAERTQFSVQTLANWRNLETGPAFIKVGARIRYDEAVLSAWMEQAA